MKWSNEYSVLISEILSEILAAHVSGMPFSTTSADAMARYMEIVGVCHAGMKQSRTRPFGSYCVDDLDSTLEQTLGYQVHTSHSARLTSTTDGVKRYMQLVEQCTDGTKSREALLSTSSINAMLEGFNVQAHIMK